MKMTTEYFNSSNSLCSNSFDSCERGRILSGDFKNIDCDESIMEYTAETSTKASSSSIQESITNMSNSHSTPEDNFSENALSSPFSKHLRPDCDKDFDVSSDHYSRHQNSNGIYKLLTVSSNNSKSIDDTIESVLSKIRDENNKSSVLTSSETSISSSMYISAIQNVSQDYDNLLCSKGFPAVSYHNSNTQSARNDIGIFPSNYSVTNFNKNHSQPFYNYGNYYGVPNNFNNQINLPNYNRSDKSNILYHQYQCQNPTYRPYMANSFFNQPFCRQEPSNISVQPNYQKSLKRDSTYDHIILENELGINFKTPQLNPYGLYDQTVRKKRPVVEQNKLTPTKKRKLINQIPTNQNYDEIINKLKVTNHNALLLNPVLSTNRTLLPPLEFVDTKMHPIKYQKYKSSPFFIVKSKRFSDTIQSDKFLSKYISDESLVGKTLLTADNENDNGEDIVCASPSTDWSLLNHMESVCELSRDRTTPHLPMCASPRYNIDYSLNSVIAYSENDAKLVNSQSSYCDRDSKTYTQLSGSFLKRTKINGKLLSNVHIEEALSYGSMIATKPSLSCRHCHLSLTGGFITIKRHVTNSGTESVDDYLFCSDSCYSHFLIEKKPPSPSPQILIKTTPYKPSKNYKKVTDYEQYVRRRFPSEGHTDNLIRSTVKTHDTVKMPLLGVRYSYYKEEHLTPLYSAMSRDDQITLLDRYSVAYRAIESSIDGRVCVLCHGVGDGDESVCGRLMNIDGVTWVHLNCGLWCFEVFETVSGSLMGVEVAIERAIKTVCVLCHEHGAGIQCYRSKCNAVYHVPCAHSSGCVFYTDRGMYCPAHAVLNHPMCLSTLQAHRRVNVWRDECTLVADLINEEDSDTKSTFRIGTLTLHSVGQLLPEQLASGRYNTSAVIYPIGYHSTRYYWSSCTVNCRAKYECYIDEDGDSDGRAPLFRVVCDDGIVRTDRSCDRLWQIILNSVAEQRCHAGLTRLFPAYLSGEQLYGLTEPHVVRVVESLPGVEMLTNYAFKFGKMQLITEMPLAVNPSGSARCEPKLRTYMRRSRCESGTASRGSVGGGSSGILKAKCHLLSSTLFETSSGRIQQYKRLRTEWCNNVVLSRSRIQGLGLLAAKEMDKSTMIIEYIGEMIRNEVANRREQLYRTRNNSIYMFRLSDDVIIDATVHGGLARYINHSCNPNCVAEYVSLDGGGGGGCIVISSKQPIERGQELTYDYKFDLENNNDDKIPCLCGAINCRRWMN